MDDEKVAYKAYEKFLKAGLVNVCVHKGLLPAAHGEGVPAPAGLLRRARCRQGGQGLAAAQLHHLSLRLSLCRRAARSRTPGRSSSKTGRIEWVTDLAEIPAKYGVKNVYADLGQIFAQTTVADPRVCAAMMGQLVTGLGADHVVWGTDAVWTGSPQWQIEALRRLEIPEDMQKKYGFKPLGPADGPMKNGDPRREQRAPLQVREAGGAGHRPARRRQGGLREERGPAATCATATSSARAPEARRTARSGHEEAGGLQCAVEGMEDQAEDLQRDDAEQRLVT